MKKLMTEKEIFDEFEICKEKFNRLQEEFDSETEHSIRMDKINEMISIANRMSELDTLNKKVILKNFKSSTKKILKALLKTAFTTKFKRKTNG
jgi:hypothetical protein